MEHIQSPQPPASPLLIARYKVKWEAPVLTGFIYNRSHTEGPRIIIQRYSGDGDVSLRVSREPKAIASPRTQ